MIQHPLFWLTTLFVSPVFFLVALAPLPFMLMDWGTSQVSVATGIASYALFLTASYSPYSIQVESRFTGSSGTGEAEETCWFDECDDSYGDRPIREVGFVYLGCAAAFVLFQCVTVASFYRRARSSGRIYSLWFSPGDVALPAALITVLVQLYILIEDYSNESSFVQTQRSQCGTVWCFESYKYVTLGSGGILVVLGLALRALAVLTLVFKPTPSAVGVRALFKIADPDPPVVLEQLPTRPSYAPSATHAPPSSTPPAAVSTYDPHSDRHSYQQVPYNR